MHVRVHTPHTCPHTSSTVTNVTNDLLSFSFKSHFLNKLGKSHFRSSSGLKEKSFQNDGLELQLFIYTNRKSLQILRCIIVIPFTDKYNTDMLLVTKQV